MEWARLLSQKRLGQESVSHALTGNRTAFESDVDRIIFSGAFRRLGRKTQVHPLAANDHVHTRLTHSLEAAHVGRALGKALGEKISADLPTGVSANDLAEIVKAACLAHDIGNPPFGHAGESAMAHWFEGNGDDLFKDLRPEHRADIRAFEGNAQGFRILTQTENHLFAGGLRLTYATLGAFHKYPWSSRVRTSKFGAFLTEEDILRRVATELGLLELSANRWCRHPLAHLVEAADDICYAIIDLEDAVELRILKFEEVEKLLLGPLDPTEQRRIRASFAVGDSHRVNLARLRGPVIQNLVINAVEGFMKGYDKIMEGKYEKDIFDLLGPDNLYRKVILDAKRLARDRIFNDEKKVEIELGCCSTFEVLLDDFCKAALNQAAFLANEGENMLKWKSELVLKLLGDHAPSSKNAPPNASWTDYQCLRRVLDYVSGMTDNYAVYIAKQLQGGAFSGGQRP